MARLTEEMVVARSRISDIAAVKKLNCWGGELTDVSLLRRMLNLEVLSISVNKIHSLVDFQQCKRLRELYVRNNEIGALNEILYLQELPALRILWLAENPCAKEDTYRLTVLKALPKLEKLDDVVVQPEEVEDALRKGRDLIHPEDFENLPPPITQKPRPKPPPSRPVIPTEDEYAEDERYRQQVVRATRRTVDDRVQPRPVYQQVPEMEEYVEPERYRTGGSVGAVPTQRPSRHSAEPVHEPPVTNGNTIENGNGKCEKCASPLASPPREVVADWPPQQQQQPLPSPSNGETNFTNASPPPIIANDDHVGSNGVEATPKERYDHRDNYRRRGSSSSSNESHRSRSRTGSPPSRRIPDPEDDPYAASTYKFIQNIQNPGNARYHHPPSPPRRHSRPIEEHHPDEYVNGSGMEYPRWTPNYNNRRQPNNTSSNILTAVMCLIMELDYDSLIQVEKSVRRRREELADEYTGP